MFVYVKSEPQLWTVGHYDPAGTWHPCDDFKKESDAAEHVAYLNGSGQVTSPIHQLVILGCPSCEMNSTNARGLIYVSAERVRLDVVCPACGACGSANLCAVGDVTWRRCQP